MRWPLGIALSAFAVSVFTFSCQSSPRPAPATTPSASAVGDLGTAAHRDRVMSSRFCAGCHPAMYAEHQQNTHGRAFFDEEARQATRGFRREDCIRCHTPRPVFETGIGMTPMERWTDLEEGNTCISCHGRADYDYATFVGGAECKTAFEPTVGAVAHCATCHRIAGTPLQWSHAAHGKQDGKVCVDCHMPVVTRPVAVGMPPRPVRSHLFPASSSEAQLRSAYTYAARIDGNHVVVDVTNSGVGHNFPTANRQRGVESLVVIRDRDGQEVARSRLICRYPYASEMAPDQMTLPRGSQIPSGKTTQHVVPLPIADGSVECRLYFKLYRPSDDTDPHLTRCLESRRLPFVGVTPSKDPVEPQVEFFHKGGATELADFLSRDGLANNAHPAWSPAPIVVPEGADDAELQQLVGMLESHLPTVRKLAKAKLAAAFPRSATVLVQTLARWSNESFNEAKKVFLTIGEPAVPVLQQALDDPELYVRCHARELLAQVDAGANRAAILAKLRAALSMPNPLDRRSAALALGLVGDVDAVPELRARLDDGDWDVVHAAAQSLALLRDREAVPAMVAALRRTPWPETHRALALALAALGSAAGVQPLLDDLRNDDELQREYVFGTLFAITGQHCGYECDAPDAERLKAWSRLQAWWTAHGGDDAVHAPLRVDERTRTETWDLVELLGGGTDTRAGGDDERVEADLLAYGERAVPALLEGLTFPPGFGEKRARLCKLLGRLGSREASPFLAAALRDPVPAVTEWACWALEACGDAYTPAQLRAFQDRVPALVGSDRGEGDDAPADRLLARAARARLVLGDDAAKDELVGLLLSASQPAREIAIGALREKFGDDRGYAADAEAAARAAAAARWHQ